MPTYEYECLKCGHRFEEFQSMTAKPLTKCPQCKGKVKRLIGAGAGFLFKGSGFYTTDYRSSNYQDKKKTEGAPKDAGTKSAGSDAASASPAPAKAPAPKAAPEKSTPRSSAKKPKDG
jgi:putative FmdB family regulatory protein